MSDTSIPTIRPGSLAYWDTFSGQVPCKVLTVEYASKGNIAAPSPRVTVKLTAPRGLYRKGEMIETTGFHVYPRNCRLRRDYHYRINTAYDILPS